MAEPPKDLPIEPFEVFEVDGKRYGRGRRGSILKWDPVTETWKVVLSATLADALGHWRTSSRPKG